MTGDPAPGLDRAKLEPLVQVGEGGQGFVHLTDAVKINKEWPVAYKEYKPTTTFDPVMLARMVGFVPDQDRDTGLWLCETTAWPAALIGRDGDVCGFLMRRIPDEFQQPWGDGGAVVPAAMQYLLNPQQYLDRKRISINNRQRLQLLEDVADTLSRLHSLDIVVGDLSPNNLLVRLSGTPRCFFIDCDAMRLHGDDVLEQVETPEWQVPGVNEPIATSASDAYKFGLLAVRLFAQDQMGADPSVLAGVSADLGVLARRSLDVNSTTRPAPGDWLPALRAARTGPSHTIRQPRVTPAEPVTTKVSYQPAQGRAFVPPPQQPTRYAPTQQRQTVFLPPPRQPVRTGGGGGAKAAGIVLLVLAVIAVIFIAATLASADDSGSSGQGPISSTGETTTPETATPTGDQQPASRPTTGIVAYDAVAGRPDAARVAAMFATYFDAVNTRNWPVLLSLYDPAGVVDPDDPQQAAQFKHNMSTTKDSKAHLRSITVTGGETRARVTFTSRQGASFGPKRNRAETCTRWDVTFRLTSSDGPGYRILKSADPHDEPC
jgi:serine/threonine protein kinase